MALFNLLESLYKALSPNHFNQLAQLNSNDFNILHNISLPKAHTNNYEHKKALTQSLSTSSAPSHHKRSGLTNKFFIDHNNHTYMIKPFYHHVGGETVLPHGVGVLFAQHVYDSANVNHLLDNTKIIHHNKQPLLVTKFTKPHEMITADKHAQKYNYKLHTRPTNVENHATSLYNPLFYNAVLMGLKSNITVPHNLDDHKMSSFFNVIGNKLILSDYNKNAMNNLKSFISHTTNYTHNNMLTIPLAQTKIHPTDPDGTISRTVDIATQTKPYTIRDHNINIPQVYHLSGHPNAKYIVNGPIADEVHFDFHPDMTKTITKIHTKQDLDTYLPKLHELMPHLKTYTNTHNVNPVDTHKLFLMDWLLGNDDRHRINYMISATPSRNTYNKIIGIDNDRNGTYTTDLNHTKSLYSYALYHTPISNLYGTHTIHTIFNIPSHDELKLIAPVVYDNPHVSQVVDWWNKHSNKIKQSANKFIDLIKYKPYKQYIYDHFHSRFNSIDNWAKTYNTHKLDYLTYAQSHTIHNNTISEYLTEHHNLHDTYPTIFKNIDNIKMLDNNTTNNIIQELHKLYTNTSSIDKFHTTKYALKNLNRLISQHHTTDTSVPEHSYNVNKLHKIFKFYYNKIFKIKNKKL